MTREMVVLKARGTAHDREVKLFEIGDRGIVLSAR
jgi:KaiC/GvpD/RAD55 family RecA-like ATPase